MREPWLAVSHQRGQNRQTQTEPFQMPDQVSLAGGSILWPARIDGHKRAQVCAKNGSLSNINNSEATSFTAVKTGQVLRAIDLQEHQCRPDRHSIESPVSAYAMPGKDLDWCPNVASLSLYRGKETARRTAG